MRTRTYLSFDYGEKYIGVAVGRSHMRLAQGIDTVKVNNNKPDWTHISILLGEWKPDAFVVGLPLNMDSSENPMTLAAKKFGNRLKARYNLPIYWVDERLTSNLAKNTLLEDGVSLRRNKPRIDKLAAQLILQAFLNEQAEELMKQSPENLAPERGDD